MDARSIEPQRHRGTEKQQEVHVYCRCFAACNPAHGVRADGEPDGGAEDTGCAAGVYRPCAGVAGARGQSAGEDDLGQTADRDDRRRGSGPQAARSAGDAAHRDARDRSGHGPTAAEVSGADDVPGGDHRAGPERVHPPEPSSPGGTRPDQERAAYERQDTRRRHPLAAGPGLAVLKRRGAPACLHQRSFTSTRSG